MHSIVSDATHGSARFNFLHCLTHTTFSATRANCLQVSDATGSFLWATECFLYVPPDARIYFNVELEGI